MYCCHCAYPIASNQVFCTACGKRNTTQNTGASTSTSNQGKKTFQQFLEEKKTDRICKSKKQKISKVTVNVSVLNEFVGQQFETYYKQVPNSRLPLECEPQWDYYKLREAAFDKQKRYNKLIASKQLEDVKLVYNKDGDICKTIPGTNIPFTLEKYQRDICKKYKDMLFYLLPMFIEDEDDDEPLPSALSKRQNDENPVNPLPFNIFDTGAAISFNNNSSTVSANPHNSTVEFGANSQNDQLLSSVTHPWNHASMDSAAARNTSFEYSTNHVNNQLSSLIAPASIEDSTYSTVSHNTSLVASSSNDQLLSSIAPNSIQDSTDSVVSRNTSVELAASSSNDQLLSSIDSTSIHDLTMDEEVLVAKSATIHRIKIVEDLIELFMDHSIMGYNLEFHVIDARGKEEKGIGIGVTRDVFTSFWNKFGVTNCTGFAEKVPIVRHTMTKKHWEAVGKILIYGKKIGYFPIAISSIFITHTLFGEESISEADVIDGFWKFVSPEDKICIEEFMLKDTDESRKRLLQILGQFQLHTKPTSENVLGLINEIAFQELIQKPNYIANIFRAVFYKCNKTIFATVESIQNFYLDKAPTNRKVIEHLSYREPETLNQRNTLDYLIKFLRELSKADLLRFLTFVTALDLIGEDKILINIVPEKQTPRGPLSRTCVPSLTLQDDYESYNVFEQEFKDILNSKYAYSFHFG